MLTSSFTTTDIKSSSVFSLKRKTWCAVQILLSFCTSLECHSMNLKIGDCSLTAASDRWNVFPSQPQTIFLCTPCSLNSTKGEVWSDEVCAIMCWRKFVMISMSDLFVLTWRWWILCWDYCWASPRSHAFSACGIVETLLNIKQRRAGLWERNWCLAEQGRLATILW